MKTYCTISILLFLLLLAACETEGTAKKMNPPEKSNPNPEDTTADEGEIQESNIRISPEAGWVGWIEFAVQMAEKNGEHLQVQERWKQKLLELENTNWQEDSTVFWDHQSTVAYSDKKSKQSQMAYSGGEAEVHFSTQYFFNNDQLLATISTDENCEYLIYDLEFFENEASVLHLEVKKTQSCDEGSEIGNWAYSILSGTDYERKRVFGMHIFDSIFYTDSDYLSMLFTNSIRINDTICYRLEEDPTLDEDVVVCFSTDTEFSGYLFADIHDEENGYFTGYSGEFSGYLEDDEYDSEATVEITIEIEGDTIQETEKWTFFPDSLHKPRGKYFVTKCTNW